MLLLTRRAGEEIMIGDEIRIVIRSIEGSIVRVGIEAPKDVPIHRKEVYERQHREGDG